MKYKNLIRTFKFKRQDGGFESPHLEEGLCEYGVLNFLGTSGLEVPEDVDVLWFSLYRNEAEHRIPVVVDCYGEYPILICGNYEISQECLDKFLMPLIGKTIYVQVEYLG